MAITITTAEVKRKAMIAVDIYDDAIDDLIDEMQPALEHSVADCYLEDTANTDLQATLKLGMLDIMTGEFLEQLRREIGSAEQFQIAGLSVGEATQRGVDLIQQGASRLSPYLKSVLPMIAETASSSTTADTETTFSAAEEVW